jgi:hypothetical protein
MNFVVFRHGYNTANNPSRDGGPEAVPVARVEADTAEEACRLASLRVTVYHNQYLYPRPADEVDAENAELDSRVGPVDFQQEG